MMEPKTKQLIIDYIRQRKPDIVESVLDNALFDAEHEILEYCHITELSESMAYVVSKITMEFVERDEAKTIQSLDDSPKDLKSIKQGDTTLEFATITIETNKQIITRHRGSLNKFRRLVF